jgi:hypothetical protein
MDYGLWTFNLFEVLHLIFMGLISKVCGLIAAPLRLLAFSRISQLLYKLIKEQSQF